MSSRRSQAYFGSLVERWRTAAQERSGLPLPQLRIPATDAELDWAETQLGYRIPGDLRALYRVANGGRIFMDEFVAATRLSVATKAVRDNWRDAIEVYAYLEDGGEVGEGPAGDYVVFSGPYGLPLCADLDDSARGRILLYQMGFKGPQAWREAAPSLTAYLECQVDLAEAGFVTTNFLPHMGMTVAQYAAGGDKSMQEAILQRHGLTELP